MYSPHNYFTFIPDQPLSWQSIDNNKSNVAGIGLDLMKKVRTINEVLKRFKTTKPQHVKVPASLGDTRINNLLHYMLSVLSFRLANYSDEIENV